MGSTLSKCGATDRSESSSPSGASFYGPNDSLAMCDARSAAPRTTARLEAPTSLPAMYGCVALPALLICLIIGALIAFVWFWLVYAPEQEKNHGRLRGQVWEHVLPPRAPAV